MKSKKFRRLVASSRKRGRWPLVALGALAVVAAVGFAWLWNIAGGVRGEYIVVKVLPEDYAGIEGKPARFTASTFETARGATRYEDIGSNRLQLEGYIYRYWWDGGLLYISNGLDKVSFRPRR